MDNKLKIHFPNDIKIYFPNDIKIHSISKSISKTLLGEIYKIKIGTKTNNVLRILKVSSKERKIKNCNENPKNEIKILQNLTNSKYLIGKNNVIELYNSGEGKIHCWMIMEYANLGDAYKYILEYSLTYDKVKMLFVDILLGYYFMFKNGYCHRDLSFENIFVHYDIFLNRVVFKIGDMGVASEFKLFLKDSAGKKMYRSPEINMKRSYNGIESDIWSLGIILFIMTCRSPPFEIAMCGNPHYDYFLKNGLNKYTNSLGFKELFKNDTLSLLISMIEPSSKKRITIKTLLCHFYLKDEFEKRGLVDYKW